VASRVLLETLGSRESINSGVRRFVASAPSLHDNHMPPRMTQESYRPRVSDRTMVGNSATTFAYQFQRTERRRHDSEHESTGMGKGHRGVVALRPAGWAGCRENTDGLRLRKKCFSLDIPLYRTSEWPVIRPESIVMRRVWEMDRCEGTLSVPECVG